MRRSLCRLSLQPLSLVLRLLSLHLRRFSIILNTVQVCRPCRMCCTLRLALWRGAHCMTARHLLTIFILLHKIFNLSSASFTLASAACNAAKLLSKTVLAPTSIPGKHTDACDLRARCSQTQPLRAAGPPSTCARIRSICRLNVQTLAESTARNLGFTMPYRAISLPVAFRMVSSSRMLCS